MTKRLILILYICIVSVSAAVAQRTALKTNVLYWATTTPNIDVEQRLSARWSVELSAGYNPLTLGDNKKLKHIAIQPEARYWLCDAFAGHFVAANVLYSHFNAAGLDLPLGIFSGLAHYRYQGNLGAVGIGYGYNWILSPRWSIEIEGSIGVMHAKYDKYLCRTCGTKVGRESKTFAAPTRLAVNIVYYLR